jgi:hypothetical protein
MRRLAVTGVTVVLWLVLAGAALADEPKEAENQPARALAIQALAILEQGLAHEEAMEKLEHAVEAEDQEGVNRDALEEALTALEAEEPARAEELLQTSVFTDENIHVVGVTVRPGSGAARGAAGIAGALVIALAAFGLVRRGRADRRRDAARG